MDVTLKVPVPIGKACCCQAETKEEARRQEKEKEMNTTHRHKVSRYQTRRIDDPMLNLIPEDIRNNFEHRPCTLCGELCIVDAKEYEAYSKTSLEMGAGPMNIFCTVCCALELPPPDTVLPLSDYSQDMQNTLKKNIREQN